jgi:hypothetical protein
MNNNTIKFILIIVLGSFILFLGFSFIYSSTMSTETAEKLPLEKNELLWPKPEQPGVEKTPAPAQTVLHLLLVNENKIFVYKNSLSQGEWVSYQKVHDLLQKESKNPAGIFAIITPFEKASYKNTVDMLDQMTINKIKNFILTEPKTEELSFIGVNKDQ